jgi:hypothetical protein
MDIFLSFFISINDSIIPAKLIPKEIIIGIIKIGLSSPPKPKKVLKVAIKKG